MFNPLGFLTKKHSEKYVLSILDICSLCISYSMYYYFRVYSGISDVPVIPNFITPFFLTVIYWLIIFIFFGLYRPWHAQSRFDEFATIFKAISLGCLFLFFIVFIDDAKIESVRSTRLLIFAYWMLTLLMVGGTRIIFRSVRRSLLENGIGLEHAIIVGVNKIGMELFDRIVEFPAIGYKVTGFIKVDKRKKSLPYKGIPVLGNINELPEILKKNSVREIIIALETTDHKKLLDIIALTTGMNVHLKIVPDMYDIISGQARTNQIYGFPLIEVMPQIIQPWEESAKRLVDIIASIFILTLTAPLWFFVGVAIKLDSKGYLVYSQERVGKNGKIFRMHKFRSMYQDAESRSGPVWATQNDPRITRVGRFLRKTRLDEIPQFMDVLRGDMSLVGPRPERPHFVEKLSQEIPLYKRRLSVKPGITGWAQIKQGYDTSIDDVRSKVRYDLFYIENMSFRMDIKILLMTVYVMIAGKGN